MPLDGKDGEAWYPLFVLEHRNGELFIKAAVGEHASRLAGRRVAKANGMPFAEFIRPILDRCSGELLAHRMSRFEGKQGFYWWLTRVLDGKELALEVVEQDGNTSAVTLAPIRAKEFFALAKEAGNRQSSRDLSYSFLDDGMAILRLPSFNETDTAKKTIDKLFDELRKRGSRRLIIDVRGNPGGSSNMVEYLLEKLTSKKVRVYSRIQIKLSKAVLERFEGWKKHAELSGLRASVEGNYVQGRKGEAFDGELFVLVDSGVFSAASDFAGVVKDFGLGTLVGYETGGLQTCFGDVVKQTLPHSRIELGVSYKRFEGGIPQPGDDEHGILPDVVADARALASYANEEDPVLALAVALARGARD
ncbi:MAG: S41 family peptidase [Myxococcales bacterium]